MMGETRGNFLFPGITQRLSEWALFITSKNVLLVISKCSVTGIALILLFFFVFLKKLVKKFNLDF